MTDVSFWQFPLSLILSLAFMAGSVILWKFLPEGRVRKLLAGKPLCATAILAFTVLTAVEGTWGVQLHKSPAMWAVAAVMMVSLGFAIQNSIKEKRDVAGTLSHLGLFLLFFGAFWGAPDLLDLQVTVDKEHEAGEAYSRDGKVFPLPFSIRLEEFSTEYYDDGTSPKQYGSALLIDGSRHRTSVNHPDRHYDFNIYQADFDGVNGEYSVLKLVRDPWLPLVYAGMLLMAVGAVLIIPGRYWSGKADGREQERGSRQTVFAAMVALAVAFAAISLARIRFGTLPPALRSFWFVPHLILYMLAYAALALALLTGIIGLLSRTDKGGHPTIGWRAARVSPVLFYTAYQLLLLGMLCGAVWAKAAWGDWWTWDAKECWAAVTWLFTVLGSHLPGRMLKGKEAHNGKPQGGRTSIAVLVCMALAFLSMQVAWYGVKTLPASQTSLHTYK